tara:strand:- start:28 stop:528 length:501 start_codon:yes stop_codon:yes gene_type:complete
MYLKRYKKFLTSLTITLVIFLSDRVSKIYVINLFEDKTVNELYITNYLNFFLIWNKGIAFGLFSIDKSLFYDLITVIIFGIIILILIMLKNSQGLKFYSLLFILGGSLGNLFDRVNYNAVPDFIDFHYNEIHWFIFNVADIFITFGVICLIFTEILLDKRKKNEIE